MFLKIWAYIQWIKWKLFLDYSKKMSKDDLKFKNFCRAQSHPISNVTPYQMSPLMTVDESSLTLFNWTFYNLKSNQTS